MNRGNSVRHLRAAVRALLFFVPTAAVALAAVVAIQVYRGVVAFDFVEMVGYAGSFCADPHVWLTLSVILLISYISELREARLKAREAQPD